MSSVIHEIDGPYQVPFSQISPQIPNRNERRNIRPMTMTPVAENVSFPQAFAYPIQNDNIDVPNSQRPFSGSFGKLPLDVSDRNFVEHATPFFERESNDFA